jgi:hypothetical protein
MNDVAGRKVSKQPAILSADAKKFLRVHTQTASSHIA